MAVLKGTLQRSRVLSRSAHSDGTILIYGRLLKNRVSLKFFFFLELANFFLGKVALVRRVGGNLKFESLCLEADTDAEIKRCGQVLFFK